MEGREMKTADRSKQNLSASGQVLGKSKHLQAFAAVTFEKVNSARALKLRARPVQHPIFNSYSAFSGLFFPRQRISVQNKPVTVAAAMHDCTAP